MAVMSGATIKAAFPDARKMSVFQSFFREDSDRADPRQTPTARPHVGGSSRRRLISILSAVGGALCIYTLALSMADRAAGACTRFQAPGINDRVEKRLGRPPIQFRLWTVLNNLASVVRRGRLLAARR